MPMTTATATAMVRAPGVVAFDANYLTRVRQRDDSTCTHFYNYFYLPVRNLLRHRLSDPEIGDTMQDVFAAALKGIEQGQPREPHKLPGYMAAICRNLAHQRYRRRRMEFAEIEIDRLADAKASAEADLLKQFDRRRVRAVLQRLLPRDREALEREFLLEQDRDTIAGALGVTRVQLRLILFHAVRRFRAEWRKCE